MIASDLPWLGDTLSHIDQLFANDRLPHGLIVHGPKGIGKQLLVDLIVRRWLRLESNHDLKAHPDHIIVKPDDGKKQIAVDTVRQLIKRMVLTSGKGRQVAVISPAEAMNRNAANSLLKTLEEPTDGSLLILVTDSVSRLLPTIISRCQRIQIHAPSRANAEQWLANNNINAPALLDLTGNAPLEAKRLADAGLIEQLAQFEHQIVELTQQATDISTVASHWLEQDPKLVLDWLYYFTAAKIRVATTDTAMPLHHYLQSVAAARVLVSTALHTQLLLESLLAPWYDQFGRSMEYLPALQH